MSKSSAGPRKGVIYTFYSFKGGVGRSMALANVAALLAKWGRSVLVVDWDLEASGIERFFCSDSKAVREMRSAKPGVVDLVREKANGDPMDWHHCVHEFYVNGNVSPVKVISAGCSDEDYVGNLHGLDFAKLFGENDLGRYIEDLRDAWTSEFDFVLIDSRTGVTDIGGICTVHLADVLVLFFTATDSSTEGVLDVLHRARAARERLPVDRSRLIAVPVPSRDESRTEYETAAKWKQIFADRFQDVYEDWLPKGTNAKEAIELLKIPYFPYWSFGEGLPIKDGTSDPASLGRAYEVLARLLDSRMDWNEALKGQVLPPRPEAPKRKLDVEWLRRARAFSDLLDMSGSPYGFLEVYHYLVDSDISKSQSELLAAAEAAVVPGSRRSIGAVLDGHLRPRPTNEGIAAVSTIDANYFSWVLAKNGGFYSLLSLPKDDSPSPETARDALYFDIQIVTVAEVILHCRNLYRALGVDAAVSVDLTIRYGGLRGRILKAASRSVAAPVGEKRNYLEAEATKSISFRLASVDPDLAKLVEALCEPLFVLFDFQRFDRRVYEHIVAGLVG